MQKCSCNNNHLLLVGEVLEENKKKISTIRHDRTHREVEQLMQSWLCGPLHFRHVASHAWHVPSLSWYCPETQAAREGRKVRN